MVVGAKTDLRTYLAGGCRVFGVPQSAKGDEFSERMWSLLWWILTGRPPASGRTQIATNEHRTERTKEFRLATHDFRRDVHKRPRQRHRR